MLDIMIFVLISARFCCRVDAEQTLIKWSINRAERSLMSHYPLVPGIQLLLSLTTSDTPNSRLAPYRPTLKTASYVGGGKRRFWLHMEIYRLRKCWAWRHRRDDLAWIFSNFLLKAKQSKQFPSNGIYKFLWIHVLFISKIMHLCPFPLSIYWSTRPAFKQPSRFHWSIGRTLAQASHSDATHREVRIQTKID